MELIKPREDCGVVGIFAPGQPVAHLAYLGLYALQHRGQESAGLAVGNRRSVTVVKEMGLVAQALDERVLDALDGDISIGHTRYSTTGSSSWRASQPFYRDVGDLEFALAHNGNLVKTTELAREAGMLPGTIVSDTDLVAELLAGELTASVLSPGREMTEALSSVLPRLEGGFSMVAVDAGHLYAMRDPRGFWPLCLGRLDSGGWVVASESPALDVIGAHFQREIAPGEMVVIDDSGVSSHRPFTGPEPDPSLCVFEFVYFSRPDTVLLGANVHRARQNMGEALARQAPVDADMVMPVPESGIPAAEGFARASGIPYRDGLVKNRYIGRTFIAPTPEMRSRAVRMKLNPIRANIEGRRLVVVDDSIVRGTTTRAMVRMLYDTGATEVHLRISSPPYRWPCFYGMDTGSLSELLAANLELGEMAEYLGVRSVAFLERDRLLGSIRNRGGGFCTACLDGRYPVAVPVELREGDRGRTGELTVGAGGHR